MRPLRMIEAALLGLVSMTAVAVAGEADVVGASAQRASDGTWTVSATVRHDDSGWDHYADAWEIVTADGAVLGRRVLLHPHVGEQPFTRDLRGVEIPAGVDRVTVRAHDTVHGYGGETFELILQR